MDEEIIQIIEECIVNGLQEDLVLFRNEAYSSLTTDFGTETNEVYPWDERPEEVLKIYRKEHGVVADVLFDQTISKVKLSSQSTQDPLYWELAKYYFSLGVNVGKWRGLKRYLMLFRKNELLGHTGYSYDESIWEVISYLKSKTPKNTRDIMVSQKEFEMKTFKGLRFYEGLLWLEQEGVLIFKELQIDPSNKTETAYEINLFIEENLSQAEIRLMKKLGAKPSKVLRYKGLSYNFDKCQASNGDRKHVSFKQSRTAQLLERIISSRTHWIVINKDLIQILYGDDEVVKQGRFLLENYTENIRRLISYLNDKLKTDSPLSKIKFFGPINTPRGIVIAICPKNKPQQNIPFN